MMNLSTPLMDDSQNSIPNNSNPADQSVAPSDLSNDPDFPKLLEYYQHAEFEKCKEILSKLEERYPGHQRLLRFKDDLQLQLSLKKMAVNTKKEQKHTQRKVTFKLSVFAVISTFLVMVVLLFSFFYMSNKAKIEQLANETAQLTSLNNQAEQLLLSGQAKPAAEIINRIRTINPDYGNLPALTSKSDALMQLDAKYQSALSLVSEKKYSEALAIFNGIEAEKPGLWDVKQQIATLQTSNQISQYIEEGNTAFKAENWDKVLSSYESALTLAPKLDDPQMKEQLLKAYLNKIISMLQSDSTSIEDIENAEQYYRKAVAMIPQSKAYASERGNLQEVSSDLLVLKYSQIAKSILEDKNQNVDSITKAVTYLNKAAKIKPKNTALQSDLMNAEYYQIGFQNFVEMEWVPAITNLSEIVAVDANYANGNAGLLLYEAYYALGKQYYSVGLYLDARRNLEQAEIFAWSDSGNLMKLFQVQVLLGDTIAKTADYKNAVSYYKFALDSIRVNPRFESYTNLSKQMLEAENYSQIGNFEKAVQIYQNVIKQVPAVYTVNNIEINDGVCLAFFANENASTVDAIIEENNLPKSMFVSFGKILKVPSIDN